MSEAYSTPNENSSSGYKYTALFRSGQATCFIPYQEAIHDTRSAAKLWGKEHRLAVYRAFGLIYEGQLLRLDGTALYPCIDMPYENESGETEYGKIALVSGALYEQVKEQLNKEEPNAPLTTADDTASEAGAAATAEGVAQCPNTG